MGQNTQLRPGQDLRRAETGVGGIKTHSYEDKQRTGEEKHTQDAFEQHFTADGMKKLSSENRVRIRDDFAISSETVNRPKNRR